MRGAGGAGRDRRTGLDLTLALKGVGAGLAVGATAALGAGLVIAFPGAAARETFAEAVGAGATFFVGAAFACVLGLGATVFLNVFSTSAKASLVNWDM